MEGEDPSDIHGMTPGRLIEKCVTGEKGVNRPADLVIQRRNKEIVERLASLPPLPAAAQEVLSIVSDNPGDISHLEETIRHDPAMTAKLLKVANCAAYAPRRTIDTVERAIVYLGFHAVRDIALGLCIFGAIKPGRKIAGISGESHSVHAIATAFIARFIANEVDGDDGDVFFTCGLLHDIGRLALVSCFRDDWKRIVNAAREEAIPLSLAENRGGFSHSLIGTWLARAWGLPDTMVQAIATHHLSVHHPRANPTGVLVQLADDLCHHVGMGILVRPSVNRTTLVDYLGLDRKTMDHLAGQLGEIQGLARGILG